MTDQIGHTPTTASLKEVHYYGIVALVSLGVVLAVPILVVRVLALLFFAISAWQVLFHGSTVIAMKIEGRGRAAFQIVVSILVPTGFGLYFLGGSDLVQPLEVYETSGWLWIFVPIGIISYVSWAAASQISDEFPIRGFLIASTALFVVCLFGHHGIGTEYVDTTETSHVVLDPETRATALQTGRVFYQYVIYVAASYAAILIRICTRSEA